MRAFLPKWVKVFIGLPKVHPQLKVKLNVLAVSVLSPASFDAIDLEHLSIDSTPDIEYGDGLGDDVSSVVEGLGDRDAGESGKNEGFHVIF